MAKRVSLLGVHPGSERRWAPFKDLREKKGYRRVRRAEKRVKTKGFFTHMRRQKQLRRKDIAIYKELRWGQEREARSRLRALKKDIGTIYRVLLPVEAKNRLKGQSRFVDELHLIVMTPRAKKKGGAIENGRARENSAYGQKLGCGRKR